MARKAQQVEDLINSITSEDPTFEEGSVMAAYDYHFYITRNKTQCHWVECPCGYGYQD